jgi:hypothetical protein
VRRTIARGAALAAVLTSFGLSLATVADASPRAGIPAAVLAAESPVCNGKAPASDAAREALDCAPAPIVVEVPVTADVGTVPRFTLACPDGSTLVPGSLTLTPEIRAIKVAEGTTDVSFGIDGSELTDPYSGTAQITCTAAA